MVARNKAVTLPIPEEMKQRPWAFSQRAASETYDRFTYDYKKRVQKIYEGKLGEGLARSYFLDQKLPVGGIDYEIYPGTTATDKRDLQVGPYLVDVKVGTADFHRRLLVVKHYFDNQHQSDFYIAVNFYKNETEAVIFGYATRKEIAAAPVGRFDHSNPVDDYYLFYESLKPIEQLVELLRQ